MPVTHIPNNGAIDVTFTGGQLKALCAALNVYGVAADTGEFWVGREKLRDALAAIEHHHEENAHAS